MQIVLRSNSKWEFDKAVRKLAKYCRKEVKPALSRHAFFMSKSERQSKARFKAKLKLERKKRKRNRVRQGNFKYIHGSR